jgi:hypothetical protein
MRVQAKGGPRWSHRDERAEPLRHLQVRDEHDHRATAIGLIVAGI